MEATIVIGTLTLFLTTIGMIGGAIWVAGGMKGSIAIHGDTLRAQTKQMQLQTEQMVAHTTQMREHTNRMNELGKEMHRLSDAVIELHHTTKGHEHRIERLEAKI